MCNDRLRLPVTPRFGPLVGLTTPLRRLSSSIHPLMGLRSLLRKESARRLRCVSFSRTPGFRYAYLTA